MKIDFDYVAEQEKYKQKTMDAIQSRGLCSIMNNTKWRELKKSVMALPFPPPFIEKTVLEEETEYHKRLNSDVYGSDNWGSENDDYLGDDELAIPFWAIEWVKIRPRYKEHRGRLIPPEIIDETEEFIAVLNKYNIPFVEDNGAYIIYSYR
jgi:hypothetical protein